MIRICTSLARAGYAVTLVGRQRRASKPLRPEAFEQKRLWCYFEKGKLFYLEYNLRLLLWLLFQPFDITCSIDLDTILPGFIVCRLRGKVCVYDAHEYFTETPEVERRPAVKRAWEWVARFTIPRLRYAYTVGPALASIFREKYGVPFAVIRNVPARQGEAPLPTQVSEPIIFYQGALNEGRGLEYAIEAMQSIDGAQLWLAGEGDLSAQLREQMQKLGLEHKVKFLGFVLPHELQQLTPAATIGLNLLENRGLSYYYSLANKAFDYVQAAVPSIQMAFPEYQALNRQYEVFLLLEELSAEAVAAAIRELLDNGERYKRLQENCRRASEVWNWETEEQLLLEFYRKIQSRSSGDHLI
ncbi:MAG: glycosyltransferase [Phaeodactylibacter sp.]|nr:glycosyltransferase [Phaeodactylibacter sp.]MCB9275291.1 glycosyltransferase [Lewinellaceae bacterium]